MTVRFNCWVEAESLPDAWEKLEEVCGEKSQIKEKFTATVLEDKHDSSRTY